MRNLEPSVYSMAMRSPARFLLLCSFAALVLVACNGDETSETTTSLAAITTTSLSPIDSSSTTEATTSTTQAESATTTGANGVISDPEWIIAQRVPGDNGATVVILLDPDSYERLTDIDIQNVVEDAREMFPPIFEVHVVDSEEAAATVLSEVIDTNDQAILEDHYLARLEEGFRLVFVGPFSQFGQIILTS